jgi:ribonuclease HII
MEKSKKVVKTVEEIKNNINKHEYTVYLDEVGAGPLCGDLIIVGTVLPKNHDQLVEGLNDSKKLSEKKRELLYPKILNIVIDHALIKISPEQIDNLNIFQARMEGFRQAIHQLKQRINITYAVIDGNKVPDNLPIEADCLIQGDGLLTGIGASSVLAKVSRDREIIELSKQEPYSKYGLEMLDKYGPIAGFHRFSYAPVKNAAEKFSNK